MDLLLTSVWWRCIQTPIYERGLINGPYSQTKRQKNNKTMDLSDNITLTTGVYQGEKRIRMRYVNHAEKNISFFRPEWVFLMGLLEDINTFLLSLDKTKTADKTWDILRGAGGNKRVTVKKFESGAVIVDFRIFNFHISPELPTKFGIAITIKEWEQFHTTVLPSPLKLTTN